MSDQLKELSDKMLDYRIRQKEISLEKLNRKAHKSINSMGWGASTRGYKSMRNAHTASARATEAEDALNELNSELRRRKRQSR